ncbi:MAG: hypothetical protein Q7J42_02805 [Sulfuritalea sp.]|nr:hypothetical protein [Sulfuritalea sp.]
MKKDKATSIALPAVDGPGGAMARDNSADHPDFTEYGATPSLTDPHYQTCFEWALPMQQSK